MATLPFNPAVRQFPSNGKGRLYLEQLRLSEAEFRGLVERLRFEISARLPTIPGGPFAAWAREAIGLTPSAFPGKKTGDQIAVVAEYLRRIARLDGRDSQRSRMNHGNGARLRAILQPLAVHGVIRSEHMDVWVMLFERSDYASASTEQESTVRNKAEYEYALAVTAQAAKAEFDQGQQDARDTRAGVRSRSAERFQKRHGIRRKPGRPLKQK